MTMKKILLMVCAAVMLVACGGKSGSKDGVAFLEKMGVRADSLQVLGDSIFISLDRQLTHLDAEQTVKLCAGIEPQIKDEDSPEGLMAVAAAKNLSDEVAMLFLWHEFGDGGVMYACTYDADGKYLDGIELGPWAQKMETPGDGTYTCEEESNKGVFTADGFVVNRSLAFTQKEEGLTANWKIEKAYTYAVDGKGKITLKETKVNKSGNVPADRLLSDDIADMARMSANDPQTLQIMEKLAVRDDVKQSDDHGDELAVAVAGVFEKAPAAITAWAAAHRDNPLIVYMQKAVEAGAIDKAVLESELEKITDAEAQTALKELVKNWKTDTPAEEFSDDEDAFSEEDFIGEDF